MPGGDRTGPRGMGPMTGRGAGRCGGFAGPGYANPAIGRGFGWGAGRGAGRGYGRGGGGRGRGWGRGFCAGWGPGWTGYGAYPVHYGYPAPDPDLEKQALRNQADALEAELDGIKKRLAEVEAAEARSAEE